MKKRILGIFLVICMIVGMIPVTMNAATTTCATYSGSNVEAQDYSRWSSPMESYLSVCEDGKLMRVQYGAIDGLLVEYYDTEYNLLSTKTVEEELPLFGGFYETDSNYFLLTGQTNEEESADVEVYRITKYDKDWKEIASTGLYDCNTTVPFDAGTARMDVCGKYLLIRTDHEMYMSSDGKNHQANVTIQLDMEAMEITDSYTAIMNSGYGYISHSFNQFIQMEDNKIVAVDHGDAYPRSIALIKYNTDVTGGTFTPTYYEQCEVIDVLTFPGSIGENVTGASVGGFEISNSAYLIAGNSVVQDDDNLTRTTRNIFVASVDKTTSAVTMNWITGYEEGDGTTSTPQFVEIADNSYMLLWSRDGKVYYTKINGSGQQDGEIYSVEGALSDCVPIVNNGKLIWYTWDNETNTFYDIDLTDLSKTNTTVIENGHKWENQGVTDGYAALKCSKCEEEKTLKVATSIAPYWNATGTGSYSSATPSSERLVGDKLYFWIAKITPSGADSEMEIIVSDPDIISYEPSTSYANMGTLTMLKAGTATVTMRPKYNPDAAKVYTFEVADHTHEMEWTKTEDGVITFTCKYCDKTETATAATSMSVYWNETNGQGSYNYSFTNGKEVGDELYVWCIVLPDEADTNIEVSIADPSVISFTPTATDQRYGYITALKGGETTITFSSKYNPSVSKTYTITVNEPEAEKFDVSFTNMTLGNDLAMNFAFKADSVADWEGHYVKVTKTYADGSADVIKTYEFDDGDWTATTINNEAYYYVSFDEIVAKEMADNVYVTVYNKDGEEVSNTYEDSVRAYAMRALANSENTDECKTMIVDMLNYGAAAQSYFEYNEDDLANNELSDEQKAYATVSVECENTIEKDSDAYYCGTSLILESNIRMQTAFKNLTTDMYAVVTYTDHYGNSKEISISGSEFIEDSGYYIVDLNTIVVADGRKPITFTIYDSDDKAVTTVTDSIESYLARTSVNHEDELFVSLMKFSDSAYAYFH